MQQTTEAISEKSIKKKIIQGSFWNALSQFGGQAIHFAIMLVLARLLSPKDFGLVGMVGVFIGFISYFTEFGLVSSIIRKKDADELDLNTAFWSSIGFALALYILVFFLSPLVQLFYKQNSITHIMRYLFIAIVIRSLGFIHYAIETKNLRYKKISLAGLISSALSGAIAIIMAYLNYGVWSLVVMQVANDIFQVIIYYLSIRWIPSFSFSMQRFRELFSFGAHVALNNSIKALSENIDQIILGKLVGASALGIYAMAHRLCRYPLEKLWRIFGKMLFPAFSAIQNDNYRMRQNIVKISLIGGYVVIPFLLILLFGARQATVLIIGEKWLEVIPILKIFSLYIFIACISFGDESLMFAINKIKQVNIIKIISPICILIIGSLAAKKFGIAGMAYALTFVTAISSIVIKILLFRHINLPFPEYIKNNMMVVLYTICCVIPAILTYALFNEKLGMLCFLLVLSSTVCGSAGIFFWKFKLLKLYRD